MNIAICGFMLSDNLGDNFIYVSISYLLRKELKRKHNISDVNIISVDLFAKDRFLTSDHSNRKKVDGLSYSRDLTKIEDASYCFHKVIIKAANKLGFANAAQKMQHNLWQKSYNCRPRHEKYFREKFKNADAVIIAGGGLFEYIYNEYQEMLCLIREIAEEMGLPVIYNAVGCVGDYNPNDFRCAIMKKAVYADCVKYVSARDSVETVQQYVGDKFKVKQVADAAVWSSEAYGIPAMENRTKIGIGLIRGNSLLGYNVAFDEESWIKLFCNIARELEKRGYEYEFFCNGYKNDYALGKKIVARLGIDSSALVDCPTQPDVLLRTISQYRALITCRMHSAIAAYSMGIPTVILSWNDKVDKFMRFIGYPKRAVRVENFKADYIVDLMENAAQEGFEPEQYNRIRASAVESVDDYVDFLAQIAKK
ncbi:MAG: polysaccharide pyruvyl transferase family protein [Ruminococcus sp.]|nr:polysaccharide pyruvyl transferase family protein [Ruminococcus sp.]